MPREILTPPFDQWLIQEISPNFMESNAQRATEEYLRLNEELLLRRYYAVEKFIGTVKPILEVFTGRMADEMEILVPVHPEIVSALPEIRETTPPELNLSRPFTLKLMYREAQSYYHKERKSEYLNFQWVQEPNHFVAKLAFVELSENKVEYSEILNDNIDPHHVHYSFDSAFKILTHMAKWVNYFVAETNGREIASAEEDAELKFNRINRRKVVVQFQPKTAGGLLFGPAPFNDGELAVR